METITVSEYAGLRGITITAVYNAVKNGWDLPGVTEKKRFGKRSILLVVDKHWIKDQKNILK